MREYTREEIRALVTAHISNCVECQTLSVRITAHAIKEDDQRRERA